MTEIRIPLKGKNVEAELVFDTDDVDDLQVLFHNGIREVPGPDPKFKYHELDGTCSVRLEMKFSNSKKPMWFPKKKEAEMEELDEILKRIMNNAYTQQDIEAALKLIHDKQKELGLMEEDTSPQPKHGAQGICAKCGGEIEYYEETAGNGDVLNSWWSHSVKPYHLIEEHDAVLGGPA